MKQIYRTFTTQDLTYANPVISWFPEQIPTQGPAHNERIGQRWRVLAYKLNLKFTYNNMNGPAFLRVTLLKPRIGDASSTTSAGTLGYGDWDRDNYVIKMDRFMKFTPQSGINQAGLWETFSLRTMKLRIPFNVTRLYDGDGSAPAEAQWRRWTLRFEAIWPAGVGVGSNDVIQLRGFDYLYFTDA